MAAGSVDITFAVHMLLWSNTWPSTKILRRINPTAGTLMSSRTSYMRELPRVSPLAGALWRRMFYSSCARLLSLKSLGQAERRATVIEKARGQTPALREGLQGLRDAVEEDGRPALAEAVEATMRKVCPELCASGT